MGSKGTDMRILQVVHGFPPERRYGTEIYTYNLSKELGKNHEVHVFYPVDDLGTAENPLNRQDSDDLHIMEHTIERTKNQGPFQILKAWLFPTVTYYKNARVEREFELLLDRITPDIINFQHLIDLSSSFIEVAKNRGIPIVLTLHDFWFMCPRNILLRNDCSICGGPEDNGENCYRCWNKSRSTYLIEMIKYPVPKSLSILIEIMFMAVNNSRKYADRKKYLQSLLLKVDRIIAPSRFLRDMFIQYGIPEDSIIYSGHGCDLGAFKGFHKKRHDKLVFGFAGGLGKHKGVHVLIEAFNKVKTENVELRIYGPYDPHSKCFNELQVKADKNRIKFMGGYDDFRLPYSEIDVLIVPSICYESFSLVVQEAFITQTPVIVSDIGALPEFVKHNETGLLFEPGDPEDLYKKIKSVIENPNLIGEFKANIKPVKTIQEQARELEEIYENLIAKVVIL